MAVPLIEITNLKKDYYTGEIVTEVLNNISFTIQKGEFTSIMGPSGSGKSTLMNILGFLDQPTSGEYKLDGINVEKLADDELAQIRNQKIGFIFQSFNLLPRTSALDNVRLPLVYAGVPHHIQIEKAQEALAMVNLTHRLDHYPNALSGGEQQRVAIARALINNPLLILADEPTGNLDGKSTHEIISLLQKLNQEGHTILVITHERDVAEHSKRILHLHYGQIIKEETFN
jgi:putative ABC transport system ATP-binding protein